MYLPNLLELSFLMVFAFPKAFKREEWTLCTKLKKYPHHCIPSRIGFASRICCSIQLCWPLTAARNCSMSLVLSVLPAPDSPLESNSELLTCSIFDYWTVLKTRQSPYDNTLVMLVPQHVMISIVADRKYVRWKFANFFVAILFNLFVCIDR